MSQPETPAEPASNKPSPPVVTVRRVFAGLCLVVPCVAVLWISSFAKESPSLGGMPFFYWYQIMWVVICAVLTYVAYLLMRADERARRQARADDALSGGSR